MFELGRPLHEKENLSLTDKLLCINRRQLNVRLSTFFEISLKWRYKKHFEKSSVMKNNRGASNLRLSPPNSKVLTPNIPADMCLAEVQKFKCCKPSKCYNWS